VTQAELQALIFDFDGLIIDTERVEADCIIEVGPETRCRRSSVASGVTASSIGSTPS
jgi:beta-phosphoglucomutase-like phosphatase (HAD superfamily)